MTRLILALMRRSADAAVAERDGVGGDRIARYTGVARGIVIAVFAFLFAGSAFAISQQSTRYALLVTCVECSAFLLLGAALVLEMTRVEARCSVCELRLSSPWSGERKLRWDDVVHVRFSRAANWFVLRGRDGTKIRLATLLGGLPELLDDLKRRADPALQSQIDTAIAQWKRH
ncbi:MAG TPA: PH domain-containing protein [Polyangiaceae bacterium]|jgi:hypothetical protein|nr:PH domain-containing protein [Polyangiaceae bacterium]